MNGQMMRRLLALALSALILLGSCSIAETVPAVGEESAPAVLETAMDAVGEAAVEESVSDEPAEAADAAVTEEIATEPADAPAEVANDAAAEPAAEERATDPADASAAEDADETEPDADETKPEAAIEIEEIRLPESIELEYTYEYQLAPELLPAGAQGKLSYSVENNERVSVDENGLLRGLWYGDTIVTVTAENGCSASCKVTVIKIRPTQLVLPEEVRILEGRDQLVRVQQLPEGAFQELTYSIADPEIAEVRENGWVYAIRPGTTQLTVTAENGVSASTPLVVEQEGAEYYEITDGVLTKYKGGAHYVNVPEGVTAIGSKAFAERTDLWEVTLPASLQHIEYGAFAQCKKLEKLVMGDNVSGIGDNCFEDCYALRSVRLSASLAEIGKSAFEDCTSLSAIELPASLRSIGATAFNGCSALKEIQLPDVTFIGGNAFRNTAITHLTVPGSLGKITTAFLPSKVETVKLCEGITAIEQWSFVSEQPIKWIELPYSLTSICDSFMVHYGGGVTVYGPGGGDVQAYFEKIGRKFVPYDDVNVTDDFRIENDVLVEYTGEGGRVVIPEQVTKIGDNVFAYRSDVTEVVFHDGVIWIGYEAFMHCTGLTELKLPAKLERLEFYAFMGCTGLTHVEIPGSVKSFSGVFNGCTGLESVVIGEGVASCGSFEDCVNLKQVKLPSSLTRLYDNCFLNCTSLAEIQLPAGVTVIGGNCFRGCTALTQIELPSGLQEIGYSAFQNCTGLKSIKLPSKIKELQSHTFKGCTGLTSVSLPEGLQSIAGGSFADCSSLKELYVPASVKEILYAEPPYTSGPVFANCPNLTVYGMKGSAIQQYCAKAGVPFKVLDASAASISFPEGNLTLGVGQKYTPEIRVDSMAGLGSVSFSSSSSRVTVNKTTGEITAKRTGTATITAKSASGAKASYKVTVKAAPRSISFKQKNLTVMVGEVFRVEYVLPANTAASVTFREENPYSVLEIHEDGTFRMIDPETTTLRVTTHNGKTATCTITAVTEPTAIYVDRESITLRQTLSDQIVPSVNPGSICNAYAFVSSDPEIVTVDENGRLLGVNQGTAEITVTIPSIPGLMAVCRVTVIAPPPQIVLAAEKLTLGVGEKFNLDVGYVTDEPFYNPAYSCKSSNSKYVTVSADGVVTAKRAGSAKITVTNADGMSAVCAVTVKRAPKSVKISPAKGDLAVGDTARFKWTLSSGSAGSVRFESSNSAVLEVASDGTAVAKSAGTVKVRAISYNGKSSTATITVHPEPERVAFTKDGDPLRFAVGMKGTLRAELYPSNYGSVTFASSDPGVVSIDANTGAYEVRAMGECELTVTAYNGVSETRRAQVFAAPSYVKAIDASRTLGVGEKYAMRIDYPADSEPGFSYKSSSTKVATVDENGVISAKKTGSTVITATSFNGKKVSCKVTVKKAPTSLKLNATELTLGQGESFQLKASLSPSGSGGVLYYGTSDPALASVDASGRIVAHGDEGSVLISVSTYNGLAAWCNVKIGKAPTAVNFPVDALKLYVGMKLPSGVEVSGGVCSGLRITSSNSAVATMDAKGNISAKKKGTAVIRAETYNGCGDSIRVTVGDAPRRCYLDLPGTLTVGYLYNISNYFRTSPQTDPWMTIDSVTISNDRAVVLENEIGLYLLPVEEGSFTVTVKSYNGKSVKKTVKAKLPDQDYAPEISSPARTDAQLADYLGNWSIYGVCNEGLTFPPEMFALQDSSVTVYEDWAEIALSGMHVGLMHRLDGGALLLLDEAGQEELPCQLHENGMLSMPLEEDAMLWFRRA